MRHSYQILKKSVALLCCLAMLLAMVPAAFAAGAGTQDNFIVPFLEIDYAGDSSWTPVSSAEELSKVRNNLSGAFYLTQDIDLAGMEWAPIGTQSAPFRGYFSGNGHVIRNLTISDRGSLNDFGLFGAVGGGSQIFDLGLENVDISVDSETLGSKTASNVGGLAGHVSNSSSNAVAIQNCYVTGKIAFNSSGENAAYVGGLIGYAKLNRYSTYLNSSLFVNACYNRAAVTASGMSCFIDVSGLIGSAGASDQYGLLGMQNCFNSGDINGYSSNGGGTAGGLLGNNSANSAIISSYNAGEVFVTGGQGLSSSYARSSYLAGGIVGRSTFNLMVEDCYNYGEVSVQSTSTNDCDTIAGGILAEGSANTGIENCYNAGDVYAEGNYGASRSGGIAGLIGAVREDSPALRKAYIKNSFVLSESVWAAGRADVCEGALIYTTDEEEGKWVDNGFGNIWQEGTADSVKTNSGIAVNDITGGAKNNAIGGLITRDAAKKQSTYTDKGWDTETWKMVKDCSYPQLSWQTETLGYTGNTGNISPFITFTVKKSSDTYREAGFVLSDFVNEAAYTGSGDAVFTYTLAKDGTAAQAVDLTAPVAASGTYTVTAKTTVDGAEGSKSVTFTIEKAARVIKAEEKLALYLGAPAKIKVTADNAEKERPTYTYASDNASVATVGADGTATPVAEGSAAITITAPATANYKEAAMKVTVTVSDLPLQEVSFAKAGAQAAVYGDAPFTNAAENKSANGGAISYDSSDKTVATVDEKGEVTILAVGKTTITAAAAGVDKVYAPTTVSYELTIAPKDITAAATVAEKVYDGTTDAEVTVTFKGLVEGDALTLGDGYTVTASFDDPNVGADKTVTVVITVKDGNYNLTNGSITLIDGSISKAAALVLPEQNLYVRYDDTAEKTRSVANLMPGHAGELTYAMGNVDNIADVLSIYALRETPGLFSYSLKEQLTAEKAGTYATADIIISSRNYEDSIAKMLVHVVDELVPEVTVVDVTIDYTGTAVDGAAIDGTAVYGEEVVEGTWAFKEGQSLTRVSDSGPKVVIFTPNDTEKYHPVEMVVMVTIEKADPTGEPSYKSISSSGRTLADAELGVGSIQPAGTIAWDDAEDTEVTANTSYGWTFTPDDTENYNTLTGTLKPYATSGGGSSGGSVRYQIVVPAAENGAVTVSRTSASKGTEVTITVKPNEGYVLDELTVTDQEGDKVRVKEKNDNEYTFTMPALKVTVEATFKAAETVPTPGEDESLPFTDVSSGIWYEEAVKYVHANGLMNGTGATTFSPDVTTTRGMIVTILYRLEDEPSAGASTFTDVVSGQYYTDAVAWAAANDIVSGYGNGMFGPNDAITREQMAAILYRYAQYKGRDVTAVTDLSSYTDASQIGEYALSAMQWANAEGLITGTSSTTLTPGGFATRAQVATILMRFCENMAG